MLTRRGVLAALAGGAVAGTVAGCHSEQVAHRGPAVAPPLDPSSWASVKAQFALEPGVAHLAGFVFASHPAAVREAIERHRRGLDADAPGYLAANEEALDMAVAGAAATYLKTAPDQIAFTDSTTMGLGLLYAGLRLGPGDEVLTTEHASTPPTSRCGCANCATARRCGGSASTTHPRRRTRTRSWPGCARRSVRVPGWSR